jgi:hypothetical protein
MSEPQIAEQKIELSEGEPHPAEMLASLLKAESGGGARRTVASAQAIAEDSTAAPPAPPSPLEIPRIEEVPAAARALAAQPADENAEELSGLLRAIRAVRSALPLVQRLLPLLDGNVIAAITNVLAPRPQAQKAVDTAPLETGLAELKTQQNELHSKVQEQNASLQRLAEQLDKVRDATDRNTDEQTELINELKAAGQKMNIIAFLGFALLAASIALNVILYLQIHHQLP